MRPSAQRMKQKELLRIMLRAYDMGERNHNMELREFIQEMSLQLKPIFEQEKRTQQPNRRHQGRNSGEAAACRQRQSR